MRISRTDERTYRQWLESPDGRDVDDGSSGAAALQHLGDGQLGEEEGGLHVRVEDLVPLLLAALQQQRQRQENKINI